MKSWRKDIEDSLAAFCIENGLDRNLFTVEYLPAPHIPPSSLPFGKMAVYGFWMGPCGWAKIGIVGPNSQPRYTSHHYWGCALSTLAGSLRGDPEVGLSALSRQELRAWIMRHTCRVNILISAELDRQILVALEAFLHALLKPMYEGGPARRRRAA